MTETRIAVTTPPSVNALYINRRRGRAKSPRYRAWIQLAGSEVLTQRRKITHISGPYSVVIKVAKETRGDLDNRIKASLDLLVSMGITDDDKHCQKVTVERGHLERYTEIFVSSVGEKNDLDGRIGKAADHNAPAEPQSAALRETSGLLDLGSSRETEEARLQAR